MRDTKPKEGLNISVKSFITAIVVIFILMALTYALTFIIPGGEYARVENANGDLIIDTDSEFKYVEGGLPFWKWLLSPILVLGASGGGMLITEDEASRSKAYFWATQSREKAPWYQHEEIGYNYRMSNIVAGIGRGQLKHLEEHRERKEAVYRRYEAAFRGSPLTMNPYLACSRPNFWLSCILLEKGCKVRPMELYERLNEANIESRPIWKPIHMQPVFAKNDFIHVEDTPVDEDIFGRGLCLPSDIKMTEEEQQYVVDTILAAL